MSASRAAHNVTLLIGGILLAGLVATWGGFGSPRLGELFQKWSGARAAAVGKVAAANEGVPASSAHSSSQPFPDTAVPGAGYREGGWDKCGGCAEEGAVNVDLLARVCEYQIPGTAGPDGKPAVIVLRSFVDGSKDGGACDSMPLAPTIEIKAGSRLTILVRNNISQDGWFDDGPLGPRPAEPADYLYYAQDFGRYAQMSKCGAGPLRMFGRTPPCGPGSNRSAPTHLEQCRPNGLPDEGFAAVNWENMPGTGPGGYDTVNLHLHGVEVVPHLFHPMGTSDPKSRFIHIWPPAHPQHREAGCYCYKFDIPKDHPTGSYWYHIHMHGAIAVQAWSGMAGLFKVRSAEGPEVHDQEKELKSYGIEKEVEFPVWDPHLEDRESAAVGLGKRQRRAVRGFWGTDSFLKGQTDDTRVVFLVGGAAVPNVTIGAPLEPVRVHILCATTENLVSIELLDERGEVVSGAMWHVASDGMAFDRAYPKDFIIMAGGQREDIVLSLPKPGRYQVKMRRCEFIQFFCTGPGNATLAWLVVDDVAPKPPVTPPREWRFTPGVAADLIKPSDIRQRRYWTFDVAANREVAPFPSMTVNGNSYNMERVDQWVRVGDAEEWILTNPDNTWHPFHLHVTPFFVVEARVNWPYYKDFEDGTGHVRHGRGSQIHAFVEHDPPAQRWRDTVFLPPFSTTRIWVRFAREELVGKTVAHCHFEAHSDTGMGTNVMLLPRNSSCNSSNPFRQPAMPGEQCYGVPREAVP